MDGVQFAAFIGACVVVAMIPGVSTAVILRQTIRSGRGAGFAAVLGNETGVLLWALAAAFGLSALVVASQVAYDVMRIAGAVILVVMGAQSLWGARRRRGAPEAAEPADPEAVAPGGAPRGWWRSYLLGLSTCAANPKAAVFAVSFLPQFVPSGQTGGAGVPLMLTLLAVIWAVVDTLWYGGVIWLIARAKAVLARPAVRRWLERVSGTVLIGLGVRMALDSR
ncbi:threonine/homoserine/homoserine lactone efflux protein [Thermocatellispora tengchongensis]|uniref:Threonine/homoserine/homoserine lactone efflux protein n=1 Tax=Thermocatellispora tengchongensis TaxID=1073253 RepID=A0A840PMG6_9ACTN|nr:LysE family translocator [Thermocatellispora tengchongensis]MBB5138981.1 threonine/homoserine/homoserine lactone efflux protein [Thermocatellispora tengchongensis]